jgi:hypothetical protein
VQPIRRRQGGIHGSIGSFVPKSIFAVAVQNHFVGEYFFCAARLELLVRNFMVVHNSGMPQIIHIIMYRSRHMPF